MEFDVDENGVNTDYHYTDLDIISLLHVKWLGNKIQQKFGERAFRQIMSLNFSDKLKIQRSMLFHVRDTEGLLELAGMQSRRIYNWRPFFRRFWGGKNVRLGLPDLEYLKTIIADEMAQLIITR